MVDEASDGGDGDSDSAIDRLKKWSPRIVKEASQKSTSSASSEVHESVIIDARSHRPQPALPRDKIMLTTLQFERVGLIGRESEMLELRRIYRRVRERNANSSRQRQPRRSTRVLTSRRNLQTIRHSSVLTSRRFSVEDPSSELVLLPGASGTGKSALAQKLGDDVRREGGFFCYGKFDMQSSAEPYTAFVDALTDLFHLILRLDDGGDDATASRAQDFTKIKGAIWEALGEEASFLAHVIPGLAQLLGDEVQEAAVVARSDFWQSKNRLIFALRQLTRAVCGQRPVVLCLDDLQWANKDTLELLQSLICDKENLGLMVIGIYRDDEVNDQGHPLKDAIADIQADRNVSVTVIPIRNLDVQQVNALLANLLSSSESETKELSEIIHSKTLGNVFFLIQLLWWLYRKSMLTFSLGWCTWHWDTDKIKRKANVTDNVATILKNNINNLPPYVQEMLQIASCLGSAFDKKTVLRLSARICAMKTIKESSVESLQANLEAGISMCIDEGFLEWESEGRIRFAHDQIKFAAFDFIPEGDRDLLQARIGEMLLDDINPVHFEEDAKSLFSIVDLLNHGIDSGTVFSTKEKRLKLLQLNLQAGTRAMNICAFDPACHYLHTGMELLQEADWILSYKIALDLCASAGEAEYACGKFDNMRKYFHLMLTERQLPLKDTIRVHLTLIDSYFAEEKILEAIDACLVVLSQLGVTFPWRGFGLALRRDVAKTRQLLRGYEMSSLADLPLMKDERKRMAMQIMDKLCSFTFITQNELFPLVLFKMVDWSLNYGVCKQSVSAFFMVEVALGALEEDMFVGEFGKAGEVLMKRINTTNVESQLLFLYGAFIGHWVKPVHQVIKDSFIAGYEIGLRTGDLKHATLNASMICNMALNIGRPLVLVEEDCRAYTQQMRDSGQSYSLALTLPSWQVALNLMGKARSPIALDGEAMKKEEMLDYSKKLNAEYLRNHIEACHLMLACYFGEYELALSCAIDWKRCEGTKMFTFYRASLFLGVAVFAMARKRKTSRLKQRAQKVLATVRRWRLDGNTNCIPFLQLFEAESAALRGDVETAKERYKKALGTAGRFGFGHDRALIAERAGELYLDVRDTYWASHYLDLASQLYSDWGAHAKVAHIETKHGVLLAKGVKNTRPT